ncbi:MAG TPA: hypothetical protein VF278_19640, partial [Pirellulales bacterium]
MQIMFSLSAKPCNLSRFRPSKARLKTPRGRQAGGNIFFRGFESLEERRLLSISPTNAEVSSQQASAATVVGHYGQGQVSPTLAPLTAEEQAVITACMTDPHESMLLPGANSGQLSNVAASQPPAAVNASAQATAAQSNNPDAFTIAQLTPLPSSATGGLTSDIGEPALGTSGNAVLQTGNWYASVSADQGKTFEFINPFTNFGDPQTDPLGGFCCDQRVAQVPSLGLTIWYLQYDKGVRIAVFNGADNLVNDRWTYYDWTSANFNLAAGAELDYPTLEVTNNYLYASSNVFNSGSTNSVVWRMPLNQLAAGTTTTADYWTSSDSSICLADGASSRMYMGALESSDTFRVFWVDDSSNQLFNQLETGLSATYITGEGGHTAVGPDGNNWLARDDERVKTAWISGNTVGFMWDSAQGTNRPYPFVRALTVDASTLAVTAQPDIWSTGGAYAYPAIAVNSRGAIGGPVFYGNATVAPELCTLIDDDLSPPLSTNGWESYITATGTNGDPHGWGDFLSAVPNSAITNTWAAVGFTLNGSPVALGNSNPNLQPYFYTFGRGRDFPVVLAAPVVTTSPAALTYRAGSLATAVDPAVTIGDSGVATLASVTVSITSGFVSGEDALSYSDPTGGTISGTISGAVSGNGQTVTLTAAAGQSPTLLDFQNAARAVLYADQSANPTLGMRTVTFTADNGAASNNTGSATRGINVTNTAAGTWMAIGPAPIVAGQTPGRLSVSGRVTGVAADPASANTLYLAAAGGGVWKTTNATSANIAWTPLTDNLTDGSGNPLPLFMGAIAETDATSGAHTGNQIVYAGTGEANNSGDSFYGEGILVSTNGGANWTLENAGGDFSRRSVSKIAIDPSDPTGATAYAAVAGFASNGVSGNTGIWKTTNFGATWTNTTAANSLSSFDEWSDVVIDPHTPSTLYAADGNSFGGSGNGVYKSTDGGASWTLLNGAGSVNGAKDGRIALAAYD